MLSQQGQQALRVALLNSHPTLDEATKNGLKAKVKEATKQISALVTKARMSKTVTESARACSRKLAGAEKWLLTCWLFQFGFSRSLPLYVYMIT